MTRIDVIRRFDGVLPMSRTDCAIFTGAGIRSCTSEPLVWALLRFVGFRSQWCSFPQDLTFPIVLKDELRALPDITDHSWVEVLRYSVPEVPPYRGLGCDGGGYGTWFYVAPGSGVKVNVGRLLTFVTKKAALAYALQHAVANTTLPCEIWSEDETRGPRCVTHSDSHLCDAARRLGKDSVFIEKVDYGTDAFEWSGRRQELILCTQQSVTPQCDACPTAVDVRHMNGSRYQCGPEWRLPPVAPEVLPLHGLTCDRTGCALTVIVTCLSIALGVLLAVYHPRNTCSGRAYKSFHEGQSPVRQRRYAACVFAILSIGSGLCGVFLTACGT